MIKNKILLLVAICTVLFIASSHVQASTIRVDSPANGQQFSGNDFDVSGVADANATIVIIRNGLTLTQTRSDGSGNWTAHLTGLPDGNNTITARSIKNSGYGYYVSGDANTQKIHQLRLSDNAIDPNNPFPIDNTTHRVLLVPSPASSIFYAVSSFVDQGIKPAQFDVSSPSDPAGYVTSGSYPANPSLNAGAFSADGTKYFSSNQGLHSVSVIDVATNAWVKDIDLGESPVTAMRGPNGKIYVPTINGPKLHIIDPNTDTVSKSFDLGCSGSVTAVIMFSQDQSYPYYFVPCLATLTSGKILKYDLATDTLQSSFDVNFAPTSGVLNADNTKLFMTSTVALGNNPNADKTLVLDSSTGALKNTITMHAPVIGVFQSPDLQHLYVATPGDVMNNNVSTGFDIIDMFTDTVSHITTPDTVITITSPSTAATLSNVNVSVVLGVKTTAGSLANTGAIAMSTALLMGIIIGSLSYVYYDYRKHKRPLLEADPDVHYTLVHHIRVVTIPLLRYRLSWSFEARRRGSIRKF